MTADEMEGDLFVNEPQISFEYNSGVKQDEASEIQEGTSPNIDDPNRQQEPEKTVPAG